MVQFLIAERTYRWAAIVIGTVSTAATAALPFAFRCCSHFSAEDLAFREMMRWEPPEPAITAALLDWPMGFRLYLMTVVASVISTSAIIAMWLIARWEHRPETSPTAVRTGRIARAALSSLIVGILYILAAFATGYFGIPGGPHNLLWLLGIPVLIAWLGKPSLAGCALGLPLAVTGFICLIIICLTLRISLD